MRSVFLVMLILLPGCKSESALLVEEARQLHVKALEYCQLRYQTPVEQMACFKLLTFCLDQDNATVDQCLIKVSHE